MPGSRNPCSPVTDSLHLRTKLSLSQTLTRRHRVFAFVLGKLLNKRSSPQSRVSSVQLNKVQDPFSGSPCLVLGEQGCISVAQSSPCITWWRLDSRPRLAEPAYNNAQRRLHPRQHQHLHRRAPSDAVRRHLIRRSRSPPPSAQPDPPEQVTDVINR